MRILIDNCVPWRLSGTLTAHEVAAVVKLGWADLDDGQLLDAMEGRFDVLVTMDKSLPFQQRIEGRSLAIVVLRAKSNRIADLLPLVPALIEAIDSVGPGEVQEVV